MGKLTRGQKKALTNAIEDYKAKEGEYPKDIESLDYLTVVLPIDNLNPCEIFWQNANSFIFDYVQAKRLIGDTFSR